MSRAGCPNAAPEGTLGLLAAILRRAPRLPRALCRDTPQLFDVPTGVRADIDQALTICRVCPEFGPCAEWARSQPRRSLSGVVAGRWYPTKNGGTQDDKP